MTRSKPDFLTSPEAQSFCGKPFGDVESFSAPFQAFATGAGMRKPPAADNDPISLILTAENCHPLRATI